MGNVEKERGREEMSGWMVEKKRVDQIFQKSVKIKIFGMSG